MHLNLQALLAQRPTAATLMADIRSGDAALRARAVEQATLVGTSLIVPLGNAAGGTDPAAARAAIEALRRVAHHCARPKAASERKAAVRELVKLTTAASPRHVRVEALYLLGFVGGADATGALGGLLTDASIGEEARLALERIPGPASDRALRRALTASDDSIRRAVEQSLEARAGRRRR
ncbi:MAG: hypothetical protein FJX72_02795 [Armatimonadetes bacterium]|nr:hypothetical protein [Armatimonadota bacterium]